jgi:Baseplate J-like protein
MLDFLSLSASGWIIETVETIRTNLQNAVVARNPNIRTTTPGGLFSGWLDTSVAPVRENQQSCAELVNSISPQFQNEILLNQWGSLFGLVRGDATRRSVYVTFYGATGFYINKDLLVSTADDKYKFKVIEGGVIANSGNVTLWCVSVSDEDYNVPMPANSVTKIQTSIPTDYGVTCTNLSEGFLGTEQETLEDYRARCMLSQLRTGTSCVDYAKELIAIANNNQQRLISIQPTDTGYKIVCGGGDLMAMAGAIFKSGISTPLLEHGIHAGRNQTQQVISHPNLIPVKFVLPVALTVSLTLTWNTQSVTLIPDSTVAGTTSQLIANYLNGLVVGQKINLLEIKRVFQDAFDSISDSRFLSKLAISLSINGITQTPDVGTELITIDTEGYPVCAVSSVSVVRG